MINECKLNINLKNLRYTREIYLSHESNRRISHRKEHCVVVTNTKNLVRFLYVQYKYIRTVINDIITNLFYKIHTHTQNTEYEYKHNMYTHTYIHIEQ